MSQTAFGIPVTSMMKFSRPVSEKYPTTNEQQVHTIVKKVGKSLRLYGWTTIHEMPAN